MTPDHTPTTSETFTGLTIDLTQPRCEDVRIRDIAHHLSMLCRFGGAVRAFYSVAEHSCVVESLAIRDGCDKELCFAALMHDAAEAYLGDMPVPMKHALYLDEDLQYVSISQDWNAAIRGAFGIYVDRGAFGIYVDDDHARQIHRYDQMACRAEAHFLLESQGASWRWADVPLVPIDIQPLLPRAAEILFLERFGQYRPLRNNGQAVSETASKKEILA